MFDQVTGSRLISLIILIMAPLYLDLLVPYLGGFYGTMPAWAQPAANLASEPQISMSGGPGASPETAVVISGAPDSLAGIQAEYCYLKKKFGPQNLAWKLTRQSLVRQNGKVYDRMEIELQEGGIQTVFFDISEFFGKL